MSMTDPVADMLTRLRNGSKSMHDVVPMPASNVKIALAEVLAREGFIQGYEVVGEGAARVLRCELKYRNGRPVLSGLKRVSKPGLRVYKGAHEMPRVQGGLGVTIISTSQGLVTDREARKRRIGGELLCQVW